MEVTVRDITKIALCTSLMCITSMLAIPIPMTPIVITLQTFMLSIIALLLTPRQAFLSAFTYILLGAFGMPVFAGATGGVQKLISVTGGFIIAFAVAAPLISLCKGKSLLRHIIATVFVGMPVIYLVGTLHLCILSGTGFLAALQVAVIPFILTDAIKSVAAAFVAFYVRRALEKQKFF